MFIDSTYAGAPGRVLQQPDNTGTGHVTINTMTPPLMATYITGAVVDPNNAIAERNEGNNYPACL
jgi:hypothetical protein